MNTQALQLVGIFMSALMVMGMILLDRIFPGENPIPYIAWLTPVLLAILCIIGPKGMSKIIDKMSNINYGKFTMNMKDDND